MTTVADSPYHGHGAAVDGASACFHCGEPVPPDGHHGVVMDGERRMMCCSGCEAVARTIVENGLGDYYRQRRALPARTAAIVPDELRQYDLPAVEARFVDTTEPQGKQASLLLEGVACAACTWLIERRLGRVPGIESTTVNYATGRARVKWDARRVQLSDILRAVAEIGYRAYPFDAVGSEALERRERRSQLARLFVAGLGMMQVMMYAIPAYVADGDMSADIEQLLRVASLVLTLPVVLWAALPFYRGAWRSIAAGRVGMEVPIAIAIVIAFTVSLVATMRGAGDVYYDSIAMFVFLLLGARYLEMSMRVRAVRAQQRLVRLVPAVAERVIDRRGSTEPVAVASLRPGDRVLVRPGATVPADGVVLEGESTLNESVLTGESRSIGKRPGEALVGGALNVRSPLVMEVGRVGEATVLAGILRLIERAQAEKPRIAQLADAAAQWFVAALLVLALAAGIAWQAIDPPRAIWIVVAVLIVTCPCALSLATPAALTAATGRLYAAGMLVTRGHALETLARATHVIFDKTGTLTGGQLALIGVLPVGGLSAQQCLALGAAVEHGSEHPVARALAAAASELGRTGAAAEAARNFPGQGMEASVEAARYRIGSLAFVAALHGQPPPAELMITADDVSVVALGDERGWLARFTFSDAVRPGARQLVRDLQARGRQVCLLSGDRVHHVEHVARELGIEIMRGAATPEAKVEFVRELQSRGAVVAMVGDGINDAPVLAQAQVSIAMGSGAELAQVNADMVMLSDSLYGLADAFDTAARTLRVVRQNFAWAIAYNAVAVPLALAGWVTPLVAAIGMSGSSLLVVLNALRLLRSPAAVERMSPHADFTPAPA
ncbi:MAG: heavy metal translocating P-type ATPase [Betaproteobacteria bacterium]|nr:heavy metal translocating P-type ATPase [Betaproteobacteria bacterium]MDH3435523.1 heavy metal translocating P-type ATPase [Betaproteobacteria bacterium]